MLFLRRKSVPEPEDLRTEYAAAQVHVATLSSSAFQSAAIVIGGSFAALALLLDVTIDRDRVAAAITVLAAGAVLVVGIWRHNWTRYKWTTYAHASRMREIERLRGMRKNIHMYLLTIPGDRRRCIEEWEWLSKREQECFPKPYDEIPKVLCTRLSWGGWDILQATAFIVQLGWLLMIVYAWSEALKWP